MSQRKRKGGSPGSKDSETKSKAVPREKYETPKLEDLGDIRDITLGNSIGTPDISGGAQDQGQPENP